MINNEDDNNWVYRRQRSKKVSITYFWELGQMWFMYSLDTLTVLFRSQKIRRGSEFPYPHCLSPIFFLQKTVCKYVSWSKADFLFKCFRISNFVQNWYFICKIYVFKVLVCFNIFCLWNIDKFDLNEFCDNIIPTFELTLTRNGCCRGGTKIHKYKRKILVWVKICENEWIILIGFIWG